MHPHRLILGPITTYCNSAVREHGGAGVSCQWAVSVGGLGSLLAVWGSGFTFRSSVRRSVFSRTISTCSPFFPCPLSFRHDSGGPIEVSRKGTQRHAKERFERGYRAELVV